MAGKAPLDLDRAFREAARIRAVSLARRPVDPWFLAHQMLVEFWRLMIIGCEMGAYPCPFLPDVIPAIPL
jgi:hypothetical protein